MRLDHLLSRENREYLFSSRAIWFLHCSVLREHTCTLKTLQEKKCKRKITVSARESANRGVFTNILGFRRKKQTKTSEDESPSMAQAFGGRRSQANKGIRRMPRRSAAKKDAASCEKPWGAAGRRRTMDLRMGQPGRGNPVIPKGRPDPAN